jgi:hypothetical protein
MALKVSAYLKINRLDLAEITVKAMKSVDEDSVLTALSQCWLLVRIVIPF